MINKEWSPRVDPEISKQIESFKLDIKSDMPNERIAQMQLDVAMYAASLTDTIAQARFYEAKMSAEARRVLTQSFLSAEGTDRKRDAAAKTNPEVRVAESKAFEAEVVRKLLEDHKEDLILIHHSLKAMLRDKTEERKFQY